MKQLFFILSLVCALSASARGDRYARVYMFGVATAFNDSTVYMTDIQVIDSAYINRAGALAERAIYSYQLEAFFENQRQKPYMTVALVWSKSKKKVERRFLRIRRRFTEDNTTYLYGVSEDDFRFKHVEHIDD